MKRFILLFLLMFAANSVHAQLVFEPPVIIDPPNPQVGDAIRVGLFTTFYPPCLLLPWKNQNGDTHLFEFDNNLPGFEGSHIDLTVVTMTQPICNPFPVSPAPREYYELGSLGVGDYSLQTSWVGRLTSLPPPPDATSFTYGGILTFSVTKPKIINTTTNAGLIILSILILILTLFLSNKKGNYFRG
ncbi:MAG: hypothetical protein L3J22_01000 [Xanthomonadales bacterium]|nr:hypothetical protein [Xanthomonadales bacterium]